MTSDSLTPCGVAGGQGYACERYGAACIEVFGLAFTLVLSPCWSASAGEPHLETSLEELVVAERQKIALCKHCREQGGDEAHLPAPAFGWTRYRIPDPGGETAREIQQRVHDGVICVERRETE